jgi:hypothetical protein
MLSRVEEKHFGMCSHRCNARAILVCVGLKLFGERKVESFRISLRDVELRRKNRPFLFGTRLNRRSQTLEHQFYMWIIVIVLSNPGIATKLF